MLTLTSLAIHGRIFPYPKTLVVMVIFYLELTNNTNKSHSKLFASCKVLFCFVWFTMTFHYSNVQRNGKKNNKYDI